MKKRQISNAAGIIRPVGLPRDDDQLTKGARLILFEAQTEAHSFFKAVVDCRAVIARKLS
jgi:hypothetical protein